MSPVDPDLTELRAHYFGELNSQFVRIEQQLRR
jgi:hypothetical protein